MITFISIEFISRFFIRFVLVKFSVNFLCKTNKSICVFAWSFMQFAVNTWRCLFKRFTETENHGSYSVYLQRWLLRTVNKVWFVLVTISVIHSYNLNWFESDDPAYRFLYLWLELFIIILFLVTYTSYSELFNSDFFYSEKWMIRLRS